LQNKQLKYGTEKNYFKFNYTKTVIYSTLIAKSPIRKLQSKRPIREKQMLFVP
ncbi:hypothetical protein T07_7317, partial [Trichinella nelsoni]